MMFRMKNKKELNPSISFPFLNEAIKQIMITLTDSFNHADINSFEKEIREKIDDLLLVEELSIDQS